MTIGCKVVLLLWQSKPRTVTASLHCKKNVSHMHLFPENKETFQLVSSTNPPDAQVQMTRLPFNFPSSAYLHITLAFKHLVSRALKVPLDWHSRSYKLNTSKPILCLNQCKKPKHHPSSCFLPEMWPTHKVQCCCCYSN